MITVHAIEQTRPARRCFRPVPRDRRSRRGCSFRSGLQGSCPRRVDEHLRQGAWELAG